MQPAFSIGTALTGGEPIKLTESNVLDPTRLAALDALAVLDTPAEARFDDIVRLATRLCATPVALVSLVAADRQWFKAQVGFPRCETDLNSSVCAHALAEPDLLIIPDLTADPRTAANPLVTGEPHIRFYAGAPLRLTDGQVVGSLCVIDTKPRPAGLTAEQANDLRALGRQVSDLLQMRRAVEHRDQALDRQQLELRQARRIEILAKASQALLTATDPAAVLDPILSANAEALGFDRSYIYDLWADGRHLRLTHSLNATPEVKEFLHRMPYGAPLCGIVAERRSPLVLADVQVSDDPRFANARGLGLNAYAGFPVMSRGSLRGVISFASTRVPSFDAEALNFFGTLARLMSAVYERFDGERALRESDKRARLAQEAGRIGTFEVDVETGLVSVSAEFARIYGVPTTGLYSAEKFESLIVSEDRAMASNEETRQAGTAAADVEYRIHRADDGALRWIARRATFARDEAGRVARMFGTVHDVTEERAAQQALRESEERFRTIQETIDAAFAIVEVKFDADERPVDYRFVEANPAFERQAGVNLRGKWVTEFAPDLEQFWFDTYGHVAKTGEPANFESYAEAFKRWFDVRAVRVGRPEERRIAILFNNVTARKEAEAALRASEAVARENAERVQLALAAGAIIGTWHWDMPSDRFTVDDAFARSFGLDPALGREGIPLAQIVATVHPDDQAGLTAAIAEVVARGGAYAHQYRVRRLDGRYYWIEANGRVDHAPDGTPLSFPGVLLDIEDRRAEQVRRDALLELGDRLRDLNDVPTLVQAAAEIMAGAIGATRAGYGVVDAAHETVEVITDWCAPGIATVSGLHSFRSYGTYINDLKRGEIVAVAEVTRDARTRNMADALLGIDVRSLLNVPIVERGRLVGIGFVHFAQTHRFTNNELAFVRVVADRVQIAVARVRAEEDQRLLNEEISHRLKNSFAMVLSIAGQTLRTVPDRAPVEAFEQRIHALSSAHDVLLRKAWAAASAKEVVKAVLANAGYADRIDMSGPEIELGPRATLSLSLLLHELATNAAKYGALSVPNGRVTVDWRLAGEGDDCEVTFDWIERGGPPVVPPATTGRKGFGSRLISVGLAGTGGVDLRYPPTGFQATMRAPLVQLQHT